MSRQRTRVIRSIETSDGALCVDIFQRDDGSFGFEEYRKDPEDPRGWYRVGSYAAIRAENAEIALTMALTRVAWLAEIAVTSPYKDKRT